MRLTPVLALVIGVACLGAVASDLSSGEPRKDKAFQKLKLDADDLAEVTGLNIYKFRVNIPQGQNFNVVLREFKEKGAEPKILHFHPFVKKEGDAATTLRVSFLHHDRKLQVCC